jgi:hypothetical protein
VPGNRQIGEALVTSDTTASTHRSSIPTPSIH